MIRNLLACGGIALCAAAAMVQTAGASSKPDLDVKPFTFDPGHTSRIVSEWEKHLGEADAKGHNNYGLLLSKNSTTPTNAAAGATVTGVKGMHLTELGFDFKNGSHCGAGAPRFNVVTTDGVTHFVGCAAGTQSAAPEAGWVRVRMDPSVTNVAFPPVAPTDVVQSISIIFDEGTDTGPDFSGQAVLDNIDINGTLVGDKS